MKRIKIFIDMLAQLCHALARTANSIGHTATMRSRIVSAEKRAASAVVVGAVLTQRFGHSTAPLSHVAQRAIISYSLRLRGVSDLYLLVAGSE